MERVVRREGLPDVGLLIFKLILTPLLIAAAAVAERRYGPAVGGSVAGLPLTSGPVSFFLALEQGGPFAAKAAIGTLVGLIGVAAFCVGYSEVAEKRSWSISLMAGVVCFFCASWLFRVS